MNNFIYLNYLILMIDITFFMISGFSLLKIVSLKQSLHERKQRYIIRIYCIKFYAYLGYGLMVLTYLLCQYSIMFIFLVIFSLYCFKEESTHRNKLYKY